MRVLPDSFYKRGGSLEIPSDAQSIARAATTILSDGHTQGTSSSSGSNRGRPTLVFAEHLPVTAKGAPQWKSSFSPSSSS